MSSMTKIMKLMADYGCHPLWEYSGKELVDNTNPDDLLVTSELREALKSWAARFDRTLNQDDPANSGFSTSEEATAFEQEGQRLWKNLQAQLGSDYRVIYFSNQTGQLME